MKIEILDQAEDDLIEGFHFYEAQQPGLGSHFLINLYGDIESLRTQGGIHLKATGLSPTFVAAISIRGVLQNCGRNGVRSRGPRLPTQPCMDPTTVEITVFTRQSLVSTLSSSLFAYSHA